MLGVGVCVCGKERTYRNSVSKTNNGSVSPVAGTLQTRTPRLCVCGRSAERGILGNLSGSSARSSNRMVCGLLPTIIFRMGKNNGKGNRQKRDVYCFFSFELPFVIIFRDPRREEGNTNLAQSRFRRSISAPDCIVTLPLYSKTTLFPPKQQQPRILYPPVKGTNLTASSRLE